jgi:hypothetical protein
MLTSTHTWPPLRGAFFCCLEAWQRFLVGSWWCIACAGVIGCFAGVGTLLLTCLSWLKTGSWPGWEFKDAWAVIDLADISTGWLGVNKIINRDMGTPLWLGLVVCGGLISFVGTAAASRAEKRAIEAKRSRPASAHIADD